MTETLLQQTTQLKENFISGLPEAIQQVVGGAFAKLMASDVTKNAKQVGDLAIDFELPDISGKNIKLSEQLKNGPVVLTFYRGGWCPFCNLELKAYHDVYDEIVKAGASIIAISPETINNAINTSNSHALQFPVVSDQGNKVASQYGLVMEVDADLKPHYLEWGLDIPSANGDDSYKIPVPATYIIDSKQIIRQAYINKDYTIRMEPSDVISYLKSIC